MKLRWKRFWMGMDLLLGVWIAAVFWLAFHGHDGVWWPGWAVAFLYAAVRYSVFVVDHFRTWRLLALFDFAILAVIGVMALVAEVGNGLDFWAGSLLVAHIVFMKWAGAVGHARRQSTNRTSRRMSSLGRQRPPRRPPGWAVPRVPLTTHRRTLPRITGQVGLSVFVHRRVRAALARIKRQ